jgi:phenylpyruvate tautomerase PptA (4-oxalocrotonate tautomerase family)
LVSVRTIRSPRGDAELVIAVSTRSSRLGWCWNDGMGNEKNRRVGRLSRSRHPACHVILDRVVGRVVEYAEAAMPSITIEVRRRYSQEQEVALIDAVHRALVHAFKIPEHDKNVRLVVHEPHRFPSRPDRAHPEACTLVTVSAFAGRSLDAKRLLYRTIVENLEPFGIPPDHVLILLHEVPRENRGIRGGRAACDIDVGFKIDV